MKTSQKISKNNYTTNTKVASDIKRLRTSLYKNIDKLLGKYDSKNNTDADTEQLRILMEENKKLKQELAKVKEENLALKQSTERQKPIQFNPIIPPKKEFFIDHKACPIQEFEAFLRNRVTNVRIIIYYANGKTEGKLWQTSNFTEASSLSGNLAAGYLRNWKGKGIVGIRLEAHR